MPSIPCAYLDIETTGLDPFCGDITVIGVYIEDGKKEKIIQLVGDDIQALKVLEIFKGVNELFTYNGAKFDLPFIQHKLGIDLESSCRHTDLMYICWGYNLYGGFKEVEKRLGIERKLTGIDGKEAVYLWFRYRSSGDEDALRKLLQYNAEDLTNLRILRHKLLQLG